MVVEEVFHCLSTEWMAFRANICHPCHSPRKADYPRFFMYTRSPGCAAVRLIIHSNKEKLTIALIYKQ